MVALALLGGAAARAEDPGPKPEPQGMLGQLLGQLQPGEHFLAEFQPGEYWVGVGVVPPDAALRAQLSLPEADGGLLVENIVPDGPAAKAGIRQFDVLLKAGGTPLRELRDLAAQIEKSKEGKMPVELVRGGKRQTVSVTPAKRPKEGLAKIEGGAWPEGEGAKMWHLLEEHLQGQGGQGPWQFHFLHPGQILPPGGPLAQSAAKDVHVTIKTTATLPDGYKAEIVREDHKPARITVRKGEEKWEVGEAQLDKLPEKVRPEVERLARRNVIWLDTLLTPEMGSAAGSEGTVVGPGATIEVHPLMPGARLEKRLSDMSRQIEELRKKVDRLQPALPTPAEKPDKKAPEGHRI